LLLIALIVCLAGLAGVYVRLRREFPRGTTLITLLLLAGATPLVWYTVFEPSPLDIAAFAGAAWLGVAAAAWRTRGRPGRLWTVGVWVALAAVPLAVIWWTTLKGGSFHPLRSSWLDVLFSSWHGFLSWTPVVYVATVGTFMYLRRDRAWSLMALAVLFASAWAVGASESWLREPAFGARPLIAVLVVLAPGLAYLIETARARPVLALVPLVAAALVWNYLLMVQYTIGLLPKDEPVSFARLVRQQADLQARTSPLYPFAFPANVWFAWREGVPVDRYDLLALEPRPSSPDILFDRSSDRFLLEGWDAPTAEGDERGWWMGGARASVAVPMTLPSAPAMRVTIRARSRFEEPVVEADLALLVNGHEVGQFSPAASQPTDVHFTVPTTMLRDGFNRISLVSRGMHRVDASDPRPPGPLAARPGRSAWPVAVYRIAFSPM
jgi:hypothetical protein